MKPDLIQGVNRDIGDFEVFRVLPAASHRSVGPFVFWDHFGPVVLPAGRAMDVRPHPHIGLATLTYLFEGEIIHRDSLGYTQAIRPGAVNWMTAGRGIVHSERTHEDKRDQPNNLHGLQIWLGLPETHEETEPAFYHYPEGSLPTVERDDAHFIVIAGKALGVESPVRTCSPMFYLETRLATGQSFTLPDEYPERAVYVVEGAVTAAGVEAQAHDMLIFSASGEPQITASTVCRLAVLGGEPLGYRYVWWNFVSSSKERIQAAAALWEAGGFDRVPTDDEFIPLPDKRPWKV